MITSFEEMRFAIKTPDGYLILGGSNGTSPWKSYNDAKYSCAFKRAPEGSRIIPVVLREVKLA